MDWATSAISIFKPKPKTLVDQLSEILPMGEKASMGAGAAAYAIANPMVIVKGVPVLVVGYYTLPILLTGWAYLPWIWVTYEVYTKTDLIVNAYTVISATVGYIFGGSS